MAFISQAQWLDAAYADMAAYLDGKLSRREVKRVLASAAAFLRAAGSHRVAARIDALRGLLG